MSNIQSILRYTDAASATKPTASSLPAGSEFYEYDTKERYIDIGASWERMDMAPYPYKASIAEGLRSNHETWFKLAFQPSIVGSSDVIWGVVSPATYTWPSSPMGMEIVSSSSSDSAAASGARTVHIHYLNSSFEEKEETITMDGASVVATASLDLYRINYFEVLTAGDMSDAVGNIDIRHLSNTPIYSRILAGTTAARDGVFTVPVDKNLYVDKISYGAVHTAANKYALMTLRSNYNRKDDVSSSLFYPEGSTILEKGSFDDAHDIPIKFSQGIDLKLTASSNGTAAVAAEMRGWLETEA